MFIFLALVMLIPIIWLLLGAFKPDAEIIAYPPTFFPAEFTLKNFTKCMQRIDILQYMKNSIIFQYIFPNFLWHSIICRIFY